LTLVIDASMAVAWCFVEEMTETTRRIADQVAASGAIVPTLFHILVNPLD